MYRHVCRALLSRMVGIEYNLRIEHWIAGVTKCEDPLTPALSPKMGERGGPAVEPIFNAWRYTEKRSPRITLHPASTLHRMNRCSGVAASWSRLVFFARRLTFAPWVLPS